MDRREFLRATGALVISTQSPPLLAATESVQLVWYTEYLVMGPVTGMRVIKVEEER